MSTVTLEEAQARLPQLIEQLQPGEEITLMDHGQPVAQMKKVEHAVRKPRQAGNCKGMLVIVADDEEHLQDFAEYLE